MTKTLSVALLSLLIGGVLGFRVGQMGGDTQLSQEVEKLQAQIAKARTMLPTTPAEMQSISGTVTSISNDSFTIEVPSFNPFDDFVRARTVTIDAKTKIILLKQKDQEQYQKEVTAYQTSIRSGTYEKNPINSPSSTTESTGTLADIQQGQFVSVQADQNIRDKAHFTAIEIRIQVSPEKR